MWAQGTTSTTEHGGKRIGGQIGNIQHNVLLESFIDILKHNIRSTAQTRLELIALFVLSLAEMS